MSKHTLVNTTEPQTFYVTDAEWIAKPADLLHPNDTLHLGAKKVSSDFLNSDLELKPKTLKANGAFGDFRVTGNLAVKDDGRAKFFITLIELILRK
jgi:hypothetical protein